MTPIQKLDCGCNIGRSLCPVARALWRKVEQARIDHKEGRASFEDIEQAEIEYYNHYPTLKAGFFNPSKLGKMNKGGEGGRVKPQVRQTKLTHCQADLDGECYHKLCPQTRDGEPEKTGRFCPLLASGLVALRESED